MIVSSPERYFTFGKLPKSTKLVPIATNTYLPDQIEAFEMLYPCIGGLIPANAKNIKFKVCLISSKLAFGRFDDPRGWTTKMAEFILPTI